GVAGALAALARDAFARAANPSAGGVAAFLEASASEAFRAIAPVLLVVALVAIVVTAVQTGPVFAIEAALPRLDRIDPVRGAKKLFSPAQGLEAIKGLVKLVLVVWVSVSFLDDAARGIAALALRTPSNIAPTAGMVLKGLLLRVGVAMLIVGAADAFYQRLRFRKDQRMTKDEVKREHRDSEGDPHAKQARDRVYRELVAQAALAEVRKADVLVVNPTHIAVALKYDEANEEGAPEILAKGEDVLARRMIEEARAAGVPVLRDVPLARALHELEEGQEIPEDLYEAVAIVLRAAWEERDGEDRGMPEPEDDADDPR
ncbi:MAG: EscU/YscU/HrcU family type III secretion system export apparatus switch protein, partial [Myxococcales bacterium]|nr:EscU/YscU/HrcU family type III secretion system export apparatus switch protein [Myxococcales bacterium]